ncbi:MAG: AAA family ATPase [Deltaproteobacteria bacterium]|nr:AAA family ATPase [Deltaproteobacteria bacterium]
MLTIFVLDSSAESRNTLVSEVNALLNVEGPDRLLLPRISVVPGSKNDLKFRAAPDIVIIGSQLAAREMSEIAAVKKLLPTSAIIVRTGKELQNLSAIEQIARLGADDTFSESTGSFDFVRKIILLARKSHAAPGGKLIVIDSGKGGLGVTSLAAALGEVAADAQRRVALLDLDFETQDLARFLQSRPFVNEDLQHLLEQTRPISEETVSQCLIQVWSESDNLYCIPPAPLSDAVYDARSHYARALLSVMEMLDTSFDCIIVDAGNAPPSLLRPIYRTADHVVLVVSGDPACLYAASEKVARVRGLMSVNSELLMVENGAARKALESRIVRDEINRMCKLEEQNWLGQPVPYCRHSSRWPASGGTLASMGSRQVRAAISGLALKLGIIEEAERVAARASRLIEALKIKIPSTNGAALPPVPPPDLKEDNEPRLELPAPENLVGEPVFKQLSGNSAKGEAPYINGKGAGETACGGLN